MPKPKCPPPNEIAELVKEQLGFVELYVAESTAIYDAETDKVTVTLVMDADCLSSNFNQDA